IPRTVAMTVFGDLDVSSIAQLPAGRIPISTHVVPRAERPAWFARVWERLAEELAQGRQAFVVCPAIDASHGEEGESLAEPAEGTASSTRSAPPLSNVLGTLEQLRAEPALAGRRIEALHGRMSADEKDRVMRAFADGAL